MTSEQRIAEWAKALQIQLWNNEEWDQDIDMLESAARTLIASVRAEAIGQCEQACREVAERGAICDEPEVLARLHDSEAYACAAACRALVKERKGKNEQGTPGD